MATHKSAIKRIRANKARADRNRYQHKTARTALKKLRAAKTKKEAAELFPEVISMLDKLARRSIIHRNKAANLKSSLAKHVAALS